MLEVKELYSHFKDLVRNDNKSSQIHVNMMKWCLSFHNVKEKEI